jgi:hypothetical protein
MTDNAIVTTNGNGHHLTQFGERDDIREMADRLIKMIPGSSKFSKDEALTVAQVAVAHKLDPFNGEVWGLKGKDNVWRGVMVGIKGLRKLARVQAGDEGGTYWIEFRRANPGQYKADENATVYEAYLRDTVTMQAYGNSIHILTTSGVPYAEAAKMLGPAPVAIGIGIVKPDEVSRMPHHQLARKRAEADAIKQRYDVRLGDKVIIDAEVDEAEEGTWNEPQSEQTTTDKPKRNTDQLLKELGYSQPALITHNKENQSGIDWDAPEPEEVEQAQA